MVETLFCVQGTKKLVSDSRGLVDFAVGLVEFTLKQVKVSGEIVFEEIRASWKIELLCTLVFIYYHMVKTIKSVDKTHCMSPFN